MAYSRFSETVAGYISAQTGLDGDQRQIVAYSIENLLLSLIGFCSIFAFGTFLGVGVESATAAVFGAILRKLSGGAHAKTALACIILSTVGYVTLGVLAGYLSIINGMSLNLFGIIVFFTSLTLVGVYSPVDSKAKPIISQVLRKRLKLFSVLFVLLSSLTFFVIPWKMFQTAIALGIFYQSLTLLPILNKRR